MYKPILGTTYSNTPFSAGFLTDFSRITLISTCSGALFTTAEATHPPSHRLCSHYLLDSGAKRKKTEIPKSQTRNSRRERSGQVVTCWKNSEPEGREILKFDTLSRKKTEDMDKQ